MKRASVTTIDVAHPPMSSAQAEEALDGLLRSGGAARLVRVIHGYGSGGRGGTLKTAVRNWAYRRRDRILLAIPGEEFSPLEPKTAELISGAGLSIGDVGPADQGMTLLFLP